MQHKSTVSLSVRLVMLGLLSTLAACGGQSEQEKACDQAAAGYFPVLNGIKCLFGSTDNSTAKPPDSGTTSSATTSIPLANQMSEYEPNNTLNNANPVVVADSAISISGQLETINDTADNFVFTPVRTGNYHVYLCADACDQALLNKALSLMILDQSQTTIAATSLGMVGEKALSIQLSAGLAYYAEVTVYGASQNYRLVIVENNN